MSAAEVAVHIVRDIFFVGLAGCTITILLSWISVIKGCLHDKE